jgi:hypothetical protein
MPTKFVSTKTRTYSRIYLSSLAVSEYSGSTCRIGLRRCCLNFHITFQRGRCALELNDRGVRTNLAAATPDVNAPSTDASTSLRIPDINPKPSKTQKTNAAHAPLARNPQPLHRLPDAVRAGVEHGESMPVCCAHAVAGERRHDRFVPQYSMHIVRRVPACASQNFAKSKQWASFGASLTAACPVFS